MQLDLADIVRTYAAFGDHRTGWDADRATVAWLEALLTDLGARVERHPFAFPKFEAEARLSDDLPDVHLLPLWYAGRGEIRDARAHVATIDLGRHLEPPAVETRIAAIVAEARNLGARAALVPTLCPSGSLCAINRAPREAIDFPVVLAPGDTLGRVSGAGARLSWRAVTRDAQADNLTARFDLSGGDAPPLVVTTPLSGWFRCAGERGSGLAVAIAMALETARHHPVILVLNSGHELGYLGGHRFHENFSEPHAAVLHIGSCVADRQAYDGLTQQGVVSITNLDGAAFDRAAEALEALGIEPTRPERPRDPASWVGESEIWAPGGAPMLSIAGTSRTFHTPGDTADACLDGRLLEVVAGTLSACADVLLNQANGRD